MQNRPSLPGVALPSSFLPPIPNFPSLPPHLLTILPQVVRRIQGGYTRCPPPQTDSIFLILARTGVPAGTLDPCANPFAPPRRPCCQCLTNFVFFFNSLPPWGNIHPDFRFDFFGRVAPQLRPVLYACRFDDYACFLPISVSISLPFPFPPNAPLRSAQNLHPALPPIYPACFPKYFLFLTAVYNAPGTSPNCPLFHSVRAFWY